MSKVSFATRFCLSLARWPNVRMLCNRSASLIRTTRISSPIAKNVLRRVSEANSA